MGGMTADQLIEKLGGSKIVADALGIQTNVVGNWRARGIATWAVGRIALLCEERGIDPGDALETRQPRRAERAA